MHTAAQTGLLSFEGSLSRQASQSVCKAARAAPDPAASLVTPVLPRLPACKHFLNLTNGVEAVPLLESLSLHFRYRLLSEVCTHLTTHKLLPRLSSVCVCVTAALSGFRALGVNNRDLTSFWPTWMLHCCCILRLVIGKRCAEQTDS